jgi:2-pyrone-4,6-dicarboxylate lactonase
MPADAGLLPPGAWDCHTHLFRGADGGVSEALTALDELHARLGIAHGVVVQTSLQARDDEGFAQAIESRPRLRGVALIDDATSDAMLERMHAAGIRGCRFQFVSFLKSRADPDVVKRNADRVARLGWHMLVHLQGEDLIAQAPLLRKLPLPVVIDHLAHTRCADGLDQPSFRLMRDLLETENHIWVKLSSGDRWSVDGPPHYRDAIPFGRTLVETRPDRLIWATDWPHTQYKNPFAPGEPPPDPAHLVDLLFAYAPRAEDRDRILTTNPMVLYGDADRPQ